MKVRVLSMALSLSALFWVMGSWAQDSPKAKSGDPMIAEVREETAIQERILARQFKEFQEQLLKLVQRLDRSPRAEDKERAAHLHKVLDQSQDSSISIRFERIATFLKKDNLVLADMKQAAQDTAMLADELQRLVDLMRADTRAMKAEKEKKILENIVKELEKIIRDQQQVQGQTDRGQTDPKELKDTQQQVTQKTAELGKALDKLNGNDKNGKPGEAKNEKSQPKDAGKDGGKKSGESKDAGKNADSKKGETKDNGAKPGDPKAGDPKNAKPAEAKGGDPKDSKAGDPKDAPPSEAKSGKSGADSKQADAKGSKSGKDSQGSPKDSKGGEAKKSDAKDEGKGDPKEKTADAKGGVKTKAEKDGEKKPAEAKSGKGSEDKQAGAKDKGDKSPDAKQANSKDGGKDSPKSEAKSGDKSDGKSSSKAQSSPGGPMPPMPPQEPSAKGGDPKDSPPPPAGNPKEAPIGKKQIQDANDNQKQGEKKIEDKDNSNASKDLGRAIDDLKLAKKKLEDRLAQLREEELERILAALLSRCEKMLAMQVEVLNGTESVQKAILTNASKKPERENTIDSHKLSDREKEIVNEATKAIEILEAEGTAVAFPEVFQQVREDMKHVQRRLDVTDTAIVTQAIERDIIASLSEMIAALKKADQDLKDKKNPPPGPPGQPPPQQDQKLLDQIAELKMIRSMQVRVNGRTETYGKQYKGEQAFEPAIRQEIRSLAERQERIFEITNRIAKGDNK